jgi:acyl-CoA thioesterase-1
VPGTNVQTPMITRILRSLILLLCIAGNQLLAQQADDRPVILTIGESTTAGWGVPRDKSYPAQLQQLLDAAGYDYRVVNHGRSGSSTTMAMSNLHRGLTLQPEIVLIALGGNDRSQRMGSDQTEANLRKMVSIFVLAGAKVYLADRTLTLDNFQDEEGSLFAKLAGEEGASLMPSIRTGIAGNPQLLLGDMSHPNSEGYTIVANRIFNLLENDQAIRK